MGQIVSRDQSEIVVREMLAVPEPLMAEYFRRNAHRITDDSDYWNILGSLWKLGGTVIQQELWIELFSAPRKKSQKVMKSRERRRLRHLPSQVTAYRAINHPGEIDTAISWTIKLSVAEFFANRGGRQIASKTVHKRDIFAFFDRRDEDEIIILTDRRGFHWGRREV